MALANRRWASCRTSRSQPERPSAVPSRSAHRRVEFITSSPWVPDITAARRDGRCGAPRTGRRADPAQFASLCGWHASCLSYPGAQSAAREIWEDQVKLKCDANLALESSQSANPCQSGRDDFVVGDAVRWVDGFFEMEFPRVPFPSRRIFAVAGETILRSLVLRHHERLCETPLARIVSSRSPTLPRRRAACGRLCCANLRRSALLHLDTWQAVHA